MKIKGTLKSVKYLKTKTGKESTIPDKVMIIIETERLSHFEKSMLFVRDFERSEVTIEIE